MTVSIAGVTAAVCLHVYTQDDKAYTAASSSTHHSTLFLLISPHHCCCCCHQAVKKLAKVGVKMIAMRCAGFERVDLHACAAYGIKVARVPTYSPTSVAEHAAALLFALNRWGVLVDNQ